MPTYTGPDRYCRVCNALLSHLESGVCLVHERTDHRTPDDAVMRAEEDLREAERRRREGKVSALRWPISALDEATAAVHFASKSGYFDGRRWTYPPYWGVPVQARFSILDNIPDGWRDRTARVAVTPNDWSGMTARLAAEIEAMRAELEAQYARL